MPTNEKPIQVLLITGIVTSEHDPKVNPMLRRMLESTGRFKVKITEEFRGATEETLAPYDLVLINYDGKETVHMPAVRLGKTAEQSLLQFVQEGKGIVFYHSSILNEAWPDKEFEKLWGICFDFANGSRKSPSTDLVVDIPNTGHPITSGLEDSWYVIQEDLFTPAYRCPGTHAEVLATVYDGIENYRKIPPHMAALYTEEKMKEITDINTDVPIAWVNQYGKGRVFVVTIGHGPETIRRPGFVGLLCRGAEWAATGKVTLPPPDVTNENRLRAWPYYSELTYVEYASLVP